MPRPEYKSETDYVLAERAAWGTVLPLHLIAERAETFAALLAGVMGPGWREREHTADELVSALQGVCTALEQCRRDRDAHARRDYQLTLRLVTLDQLERRFGVTGDDLVQLIEERCEVRT